MDDLDILGARFFLREHILVEGLYADIDHVELFSEQFIDLMH